MLKTHHPRGTLFYSWQADLPNSTNRGFIQLALERTAADLAKDDGLLVEPVIDRDTVGIPGAPEIGATIFRKIEDSLVFIADVSIINSGMGGRPTPNPNVLVELGYAMRCLGSSRIVLVFNMASGTPEDLPFDIRNKRILTYHLPRETQDKAVPRDGLQRLLTGAIRIILEAGDLGDEDAPPALTIDEATLFAYITGGRRVQAFDRRLAEMYGLTLDTTDAGYAWLAEQLEYFKIKTLAELDEILKEYGEVSFYMGYSCRPNKMHSGFILSMLMRVLAAQIPTDDELISYGRSLKYSSVPGPPQLRESYQNALLYKKNADRLKQRRYE